MVQEVSVLFWVKTRLPDLLGGPFCLLDIVRVDVHHIGTSLQIKVPQGGSLQPSHHEFAMDRFESCTYEVQVARIAWAAFAVWHVHCRSGMISVNAFCVIVGTLRINLVLDLNGCHASTLVFLNRPHDVERLAESRTNIYLKWKM